MFTDKQQALALDFARSLSARDYASAYEMLSAAAKSRTTLEQLRSDFETMIPLDWGAVEPLALEENPLWNDRFLYVVLGGAIYSEAIIVDAFALEAGAPRIDGFQFGRP
jgi:hypothetical protein